MAIDPDKAMRIVKFADGHTLAIFDPGQMRNGKHMVSYVLSDPAGTVIFNSDIGCSPMHGIDSDATLRAIVGFVSLRPGDTDADYFKDYTPAQMEWAQSYGEYASLWSMAMGDADNPYDVMSWEYDTEDMS